MNDPVSIEADYVKNVKLGYYPDIRNPKSFNEHLLHDKMFNRNPLLITTTDKVAVNEYVKSKGYEDILIENYHITSNIQTIPFNELSGTYIVKPNQLSGSLMVVKNNNIPRTEILDNCKKWLSVTHFGASRFVWYTALIRPKIIFQRYLGDNIIDYKFHVIKNRVAFISIYTNCPMEFQHRRNINYDTNWKVLPFTIRQPKGNPIHKPGNLSEMILVAEKLSEPFRYVRVDLYNVNGRIYFGELTHHPNSGSGRFIPAIYDYYYGKLF